jgi:radical SAM superfamily enzyme YgiQ (UPF0313 family)
MKKTDIVLIKPGSQKQLYGDLSGFRLTAIEPPLWAALLAAYLRGLGYSVVLYDAEAENWSYEETARKAVEPDPHLVAVIVSGTNPSASTMNMGGAEKIVSLVRQVAPNVKTLLGGLHPSALPEQTLNDENLDFVCQGEGFFTLPALIDALQAGAVNFQIDGLGYKKDNQVVSNPCPPLMKNLDELPMPAWDLLPMEKYRAHNWHCFDNIAERQPYGILYTSLGCPFKCTFCCINALFGKHMIRYRSLDTVIKELEFLISTYGIKNIKIIDEMFALNEKRIVSFCNMIIERGFDLNIWAYARVNTVTEKMLAKMKQAGINWVAYGFESGSKRVIENVTKGYKIEQVGKVVEMTYALDMHICSNFIFGLPEDDFDSMNETLKLMLDINAEWANIYSAMAYPGSELYKMAIEQGWPLPTSWEGYSQYAYESLPLPTNNLSGGQVLSFRDYAFQTYYASPRYLSMIETKFGPATASHIREMTKNKLARKYADY